MEDRGAMKAQRAVSGMKENRGQDVLNRPPQARGASPSICLALPDSLPRTSALLP